jgi:hypothetical protein
MTNKNWLIRTRNKKLLGPVSKTKIRELLEKGSLNGDDELTMGNGYWFWVREKNLIDKYVFGDIEQDYNPVSEASDSDISFINSILNEPVTKSTPVTSTQEDLENFVYPEGDDLAYPDMAPPPVSNIVEEDEDALPSHEDLEYPDMDMMSESEDVELPPPPTLDEELGTEEYEAYNEEDYDIDDVDAELDSRKSAYIQDIRNSEVEDNTDTQKHIYEQKKRRNDRYLFIVIVVLLMMIAFVLYLYYNLFSSPFPLVGMNSAHAQTLSSPQSLSKKKVFLS